MKSLFFSTIPVFFVLASSMASAEIQRCGSIELDNLSASPGLSCTWNQGDPRMQMHFNERAAPLGESRWNVKGVCKTTPKETKEPEYVWVLKGDKDAFVSDGAFPAPGTGFEFKFSLPARGNSNVIFNLNKYVEGSAIKCTFTKL